MQDTPIWQGPLKYFRKTFKIQCFYGGKHIQILRKTQGRSLKMDSREAATDPHRYGVTHSPAAMSQWAHWDAWTPWEDVSMDPHRTHGPHGFHGPMGSMGHVPVGPMGRMGP